MKAQMTCQACSDIDSHVGTGKDFTEIRQIIRKEMDNRDSAKMRIIALSGFMGAGKSTVGYELSRMLCCDFIDLDLFIEENEGMAIPEIFSREGESGFRKRENRCLAKAIADYSGAGRLILSLGGGTLTVRESREIVKANAFCIYLEASAQTLAMRLEAEAGGRPMLQEKRASGEPEALYKRIDGLLSARRTVYEGCADLTVRTDALDISGTAGMIISRLGLRR